MIAKFVLPLARLLGVYHTIDTLNFLVHNEFLLIPSIKRVIFLQIVFVDQILPYNTNYNTKNLTFQYIYPYGNPSFLITNSHVRHKF